MNRSRLRVIIADDYAPLRRLLARYLSEAVTVVGEAENGTVAVETSARLHPDVIVLDYHMPGMDGLAAAVRIKAQSQPPAIVLFTSDTGPDVFERAHRVGVDLVLNKDVPYSAVTDALYWAVSLQRDRFQHDSL